jgi:hypothetical protein
MKKNDIRMIPHRPNHAMHWHDQRSETRRKKIPISQWLEGITDTEVGKSEKSHDTLCSRQILTRHTTQQSQEQQRCLNSLENAVAYRGPSKMSTNRCKNSWAMRTERYMCPSQLHRDCVKPYGIKDEAHAHMQIYLHACNTHITKNVHGGCVSEIAGIQKC